jgi:hypothetical protein
MALNQTLQAGVIQRRRCKWVRVTKGEARRLPRTALTIRILSGEAWITLDDQDLVARGGETVTLPVGRFPAIISALGKRAVRYEIA